jgi:hypothetical protein
MKALTGWIVGVLGLGLFVGSFYGGTAARERNDGDALQGVLASAPEVDCGTGREAVLEPVVVDGRTTVRVKCIATARERSVASSPAPAAPTSAPAARKTRSTKESALIIGGSAGAGAGIGAIAKGKRGAALGAAIGGVAGTVYDLVTKN